MTKRRPGFTIVELMVAIAVILILFTIVVLSYGNWRKITASKEVTNDLKAAASAMVNARNYSTTGYPTAIPSTFTPSPNVNVIYGNGTTVNGYTSTFCLSGKSTAISSVQYKVTDNSDPVPGQC